jgi:hypothetical protein
LIADLSFHASLPQNYEKYGASTISLAMLQYVRDEVKRYLLEKSNTSTIDHHGHQHFTFDQIPVRA